MTTRPENLVGALAQKPGLSTAELRIPLGLLHPAVVRVADQLERDSGAAAGGTAARPVGTHRSRS